MFKTNWFSNHRSQIASKTPKASLNLECLETRENPVNIQIDYRFDNGFFTNNADPNAAVRRATLERAASDLGSRINTPLAAINPGGVNSWTARVFDPRNPHSGAQLSITNLSVPADTIIVFASGGAGGEGEAGLGGFGGYSAGGTQQWLDSLSQRGPIGLWGGAVSFNQNINWNNDLSAPTSSELDLYTVSVHELGHVLGFGTANSWFNLASSGFFQGGWTIATYGSAPQVSTSDPGHWQHGLLYNGTTSVMQPSLNYGERKYFSNLDYASLADIGWSVLNLNAQYMTFPNTPTSSASTTPQANVPIVSSPTSFVGDSFGVTTGNTTQIVTLSNGALTPVSSPFSPYPGYDGPIRTASADVNRDGVLDLITAPGKGGGPLVKIFDGRSGALLQQFFAFEEHFRGGVFVAAGDFNNDGRVDLIVSAGTGGGPRVAVYDGRTVSMAAPPTRLAADFFAFEMNQNNGTYVAVGDVNGDGFGDLIVGAGEGGGPRVKVLSGKTLTHSGSGVALNSLLHDFFLGDAYNPSGARVSARDLDGDGIDEIIGGSGINSRAQVLVRSNSGQYLFDVGRGQTLPFGVFVG